MCRMFQPHCLHDQQRLVVWASFELPRIHRESVSCYEHTNPISLTNFAAEVEGERAKQRTYDALLRKAKAGHVTGGGVYGYDNREIVTADGQRLHVVRVVNQSQAATVRRVFEMYSSKIGLTRIARILNAEGVPSPRSKAGWAPSAIREMLYRPLYRGEIVWNEYQKIERGGTKRRRRGGSTN